MIEEEFIKKEAIRTMKKDIARLQEEAAAKEVIPRIKVTEPAIEEEQRKKEAAVAKAMAAKEEEERRMAEEKRMEEEEERRREGEGKIEKKRRKEEEIRKKEEIAGKEILKKEEPKITKKELFLEKEKIEEEKTKIAESFKELAEKKKPLEIEKTFISGELKEVEENFQIITAQEREIEEGQSLIEEKEEVAKTVIEKRQLEKQRWQIEEKRRVLEKKRWPLDEKIRQLNDQLKELDSNIRKIEFKEKELMERQKEILAKEREIQAGIEKIEIAEEILKIERFKKSLEGKKNELLLNLKAATEGFTGILARERKIEQEKKLIEEKERAAKGLKERGELEKKRWEIEEKRREVEGQRWQAEEEKSRIESQLKNWQRRFQTISAKKEELVAKLKGEKPMVGSTPPKPIEEGKPIEEKKIVKEEEPVEEEPVEEELVEEERIIGEDEKKRIEEAKKRIEALKRESEERESEEKKEREEVREKEKEDREKEEEEIKKKEAERRELLARLQRPLGEKKPPVVLPKAPTEFIRVVPKSPSFREKLLVRISLVSLILVLLSGIGTFWYWFFIARKQPPLITKCQTDADCLTGQICGPEGNCLTAPPIARCTKDTDCPSGQICQPLEGICLEEEPGITIPPSLFSVDNTRNLTISNSEELRSLLLQTLQEWQEEGQFTRLIIKNTRENKILGLREFLEVLLIRVPEEFYQKLENGFNLFIYSQSEGNRLGFITKIKNYEGLVNLLRKQETTMESDFETLFTLMGKAGPAIVPYFRSAINVPGYAGPNFKYQTVTRQDLGIFYLFSGDYFVFTSSWKSMEKVIEKLGIIGERIEITTELKRGDGGYEVELLQTWLSQDTTIYPQAIVNGIFGPLTETAVIRFQEKYAPEILAPQGLSQGTGVVDSYTRIKINELYGESGIKPRITELVTDLRIGASGEAVKLLQTWLAKDRNVYPQAITSGYFGYLTQQAVIRFQEKYTSEILTPQGLSKGTGIVDSLTRKKLNELYGQ